jgi:UDP-galactose transporter B1
VVVAGALGDLTTGVKFCTANPVIFEKILKFAVCSAIGQSFIFYTISEFNSLVCTTVTTTRKVFSVLLSIFINGHTLSSTGWAGIVTACAGILSELLDNKGGKGHGGSHAAPSASADAVAKKEEAKKTK